MIIDKDDVESKEEDDQGKFKVIVNKSQSVDELANNIKEKWSLTHPKLNQYVYMTTEDQEKIEGDVFK